MKKWKEELNEELVRISDGLYSITEFTDEQIKYVWDNSFCPSSGAFHLIYVGVYV